MGRAWALLVALGACISDPTVPCGDLRCPTGDVCTAGGCASPAAVAACAGLDEAASCALGATAGLCLEGACREVICGDGKLYPGELCDDANRNSGDGCSADCLSDETCGNGYTDSGLGEQCDDANFLSSDGCSSTCGLEQPRWSDASSTPIGPRGGMAAAFDVRRGRVVAFGGFSNAQPFGDTWEWDGSTWSRAVPISSPSVRANATMTYDTTRRRIVLFGGTGPQGALADTWLWDGVDWTEITSAVAPPRRAFSSMTFDAARDRVVLYGGSNETGELDDTWELSGNAWSHVTTANQPPPLSTHQLAYDEARATVVMTGESRTWEFNGGKWAEIAAVEPLPVGYGLSLAYNSARGRVVAFGGGTAGIQAGYQSGLWEWTGSTWSAVPNGDIPPARRYALLAYDSGRDELILYGGDTFAQPPFDDMWRMQTAAGWTQVTLPPVNPQPLWAVAGVYEPLGGYVLIHGGVTTAGTLPQETWLRDRRGWTMQNSGTPLPAGFECQQAVFHAARGRITMFGTAFASLTSGTAITYEWTGSLWINVSPAAQPPELACGRVMAYDAARGRSVLFGGAAVSGTIPNDTYEWDGAAWHTLSPNPSPPPRSYAAMAYDPIRERTVLFGGQSTTTGARLDDTWEWDGTTWTQPTPPISPPPRAWPAMTYDPQRKRIVLYGGSSLGTLGDTWEWDGTTWTRTELLDFPPARNHSKLVYDAILRQRIYFGGIDFRNQVRDTTLAFEYTSQVSIERCLRDTNDDDGDGLAGCADPDCWGRCTPLCPPGAACPASAPRCGDGMCIGVEDSLICPQDCGGTP